MRIAVMGAGSLGIVIGGLIAKNGHDVDLIAAREESVMALNNRGAVIKGAIETIVPVKAITPSQMQGSYDYVLLVTKRAANDVALTQLRSHLHDNSLVCTLQNGMPEEAVSAYIGKKRTVGGVVLIGATRLAPGVSLITSSLEVLEKYAFEIGEFDGQLTPGIYAMQEILSTIGGCTVIENLINIRWSKLLVNATFGGMTAMLGCVCNDILKNRDAMNIVAHIADETIKTAHACGYRLAPLQGKDLEFLELQPGQDVDDKMDFYRSYFWPYANTKGSMLQDLEHSRKTEINYINGYICLKGKENGVPTRYNELVVRLVTEAEAQGKVPNFEANLEVARRLYSDK